MRLKHPSTSQIATGKSQQKQKKVGNTDSDKIRLVQKVTATEFRTDSYNANSDKGYYDNDTVEVRQIRKVSAKLQNSLKSDYNKL